MINLWQLPSTLPFHLKRVGLYVRGVLRDEPMEWITRPESAEEGYLVAGSLPCPDLDQILLRLEASPLPHHRVFLVGQVRTDRELENIRKALQGEGFGGFIEFGTGVGGASAHLCPCLGERITSLQETGRGWILDSPEAARLFIRAIS